MEITKELLQTIYERANQYAITKFGSEPHSLSLESDGTIAASWTHYHCGDSDTETEYITAENLTEDLDVIAAERRKKEEEAQLERKRKQLEEDQKRAEREKQNRKQQYQALKKEFEN